MEGIKLNPGELAPEFSLPDLDGSSRGLSDFRGRITVINFWSAECPWSERVDGALRQHLARWADQVNYVTIACNKNEPRKLLRAEAKRRGLGLVLHDAEQQVADSFGARTTPHIFVLDAEGVLRYRGAFDNVTFRQRTPTLEYLPAVVDALLAGEEPPWSETPTFGCTIVHYVGD